MARKYVNLARSSVTVTDEKLSRARDSAADALARLSAAEGADPLSAGWEDEYTAASAASRAAARRVDALETLRAAQVERGGKRDAAVKAASAELDGIAAALGASRDQVAAAAVAHLTALAGLAGAIGSHNALLARSRARVAELGLRVKDDLVAEGEEHPEGVLDSGQGLRAGGVNWTVIPAPGIVSHGLREVFTDGHRGPFLATKYDFRAHEVERRPDGLAVPVLADVGAQLPPTAAPPVMPTRATLADLASGAA